MKEAEDAPGAGVERSVLSVENIDEGPKSQEILLRRRPLWKFFAVFAALVVLAGGAVYWFTSRPDPFKVLVAIDVDGQWWEGSRPAATLADEIGEGLKKIGFEPVKGGDPEVDKILSSSKTPEEAARRLGAGFIITGSLSPELIEHPNVGGATLVEARSDTKLQVRFIGDREGKAEDVPVSAHGYGMTKPEALAVLADGIAESVFDVAVPKLVEHDVIKTQLDRGDITTVSRLQKAKDYVELRARRLDHARKAYQKADAEHVEYKGDPVPITYHGNFDELDFLAGVSKDRVLILAANVSPFIHPVSMELGWKYQLETLAWRADDGKDQVLWRGYHVLGFPAAARKGGDVALVEDLYGRAKTLSVIKNAPAERLRVDSSARFSDLALSPSGASIALTERPCRQCVESFNVLSVAAGKSLYMRNAKDERRDEAKEIYFGFDWLDDKQIVLAVKDARPPPPADPADGDGPDAISDDPKRGGEELRVIDVSKDPPLERLIFQLDAGEACSSPAASPDAKQIAMTCGGRIAFFDSATGDQAMTDEIGFSPVWAADSTLVAFVRDGDIYVMTVQGRKVKQLTKNAFAENRPMFATEGRRLYFQSQQQDPNIDSRLTSVIASVEVP